MSSYDLHVVADWYLYCIGCDLLTRVQRTSQNRRLIMLSELWFRSNSSPLLRITYCNRCILTIEATQAPIHWSTLSINRNLIEESRLWKRLMALHRGHAPGSATGSFFHLENPNTITLSVEFTYRITDYGRDYFNLKSRYPALIKRDFGRFKALATIDSNSQGLVISSKIGSHAKRS